MKRALITGITGMDGSHLADLLLDKGYEVHGLVRRCSRPIHERIEHILDRVHLHEGDLLDESSLYSVMQAVDPHEVYNLAAQSFVGTSWRQPVLTAEVTGLGTLRLLNAVRGWAGSYPRVYQASSSEMFGNAPSPQDERTALHPRSPYGCAKAFAHNIAVNYRESYGMHVSCGILFNHESERRGLEFVTRKISRQVAEWSCGLRESLTLGNIKAQRDWGYAPDYVEAMWLMLQQSEPSDFVIATGVARSVEDFLLAAVQATGKSTLPPIIYDPGVVRPAELHLLKGRATKARNLLGWTPRTDFQTWVGRMVMNDIDQLHVVGLV